MKVLLVPNQITLSVLQSLFQHFHEESLGVSGVWLGDSMNKRSSSTEKSQPLKISGELHNKTPAFWIYRIVMYLYQDCLLAIFS